MTGALDWAVLAVGVLLVLGVLRDIFHTLWHPRGQGVLAQGLMRGTWRLSKSVPVRRLKLQSGPLAMVAVIVSWALLMALGWALVYWPNMPEGFAFSSSLQPGTRSNVVDALYVSLVTLATLGFGDVMPTPAWLRLAVPVQALMGFALLTAAVTWVLQVYPALVRRRALSRWLAVLRSRSTAEELVAVDSPATADLVLGIGRDLTSIGADLAQYSETYYYRDADEQSSLPGTIEYARKLSEAAARAPRGDVRLAGAALAGSLEELSRELGEFVDGESAAERLDAYAADHGFA